MVPSIREARFSDAEPLAALAIHVWLHTYATRGISPVIARYVLSELTPEKFTELLSQERSVVLIAEIEGNLVGYAAVSVGAVCPSADSTVELATLYVQEHFTRSGIGSALLAESRSVARRAGSDSLWLAVNAENERAIVFYESRGFVRTGTSWFELGDERHRNLVLVCADG